jgi:hypothetical protein
LTQALQSKQWRRATPPTLVQRLQCSQWALVWNIQSLQ